MSIFIIFNSTKQNINISLLFNYIIYKSGNIFIDTYSLTKGKNVTGTYYPIKSQSQIIPAFAKEKKNVKPYVFF